MDVNRSGSADDALPPAIKPKAAEDPKGLPKGASEQASQKTHDMKSLINPEKTEGGQPIKISDRKVDLEELVLDTDKTELKADISKVMKHVKNFVLNDESELARNTREKLAGKYGRDWMVYAPVASFSNDILGLLKSWNEDDWSLEHSIGLLTDVALLTKDLYGGAVEDTLSQPLWDTRGKDHGINKEVPWVKDLNEFGVDVEKGGLKAGPSLSTAMTLRFLRRIDATDGKTTESVVNGLVLYWKNSILKRISGQYHTTAEVWAAYSYHLEKHYYKMDVSDIEKK